MADADLLRGCEDIECVTLKKIKIKKIAVDSAATGQTTVAGWGTVAGESLRETGRS